MTAQTRRQLKPGAVLQVDVDGKDIYLHYLGRHAEYGDAIRVLGHDFPPPDAKSFAKAAEAGYVTFYPATTAVNKGLASVVEQRDQVLGLPPILRRAGARASDGKVLTWIIEDDGRETVVRQLSEAQRRLPIAAIWNHEFLCSRVRSPWRPEDEV